MPRITIQDVKSNIGVNNTYDIMNAITNSNGDKFAQYVPLANANNIAEIGAGIMIEQAVQNDFLTALIDRIGKVVVHRVALKNQLKKFKKGLIPEGRTIEEIFTDIAKGFVYDPEDAENTVFKRTVPDVKTLYHERNRQEYYPATVSKAQLKTAFTSWGNFENFIVTILNAVYNASEVDEYEYMKLVIDNYFSKGYFTVIGCPDPVDATSTKEFVKLLRATATKMTLPNGSRDYNAMAVRTVSDMSDLHLLIDADLMAEMDVDVLASAFNMDKTNFVGNVTVIDNFASDGLFAVLIDQQWFQVYDNEIEMSTIYNPKGLYWNYFYHIWQTLSASRFSNAVAFVDNTKIENVYNVIVDPTISSVKAGKTLQFTAYVRQTDTKDYPITWAVVANDSDTTVAAGTKIDTNGLLTIDAAQTGDLKVTGSVVSDGFSTTLTAAPASGATILDVQDSSGFKAGYMVLVGTEPNSISIASVDSATQITLSSGLTAAQVSGASVTKQITTTGAGVVNVA